MALVIRVTWDEFNALAATSYRPSPHDRHTPFLPLLNETERARLEGERGVRIVPQRDPPLVRLDIEEP